MSEVKLDVKQMEKKLASLTQTIDNLHLDVKEPSTGQTMLELSEKINDINQHMKQMFEAYKQLAEQHVNSTKLVVESLEETERLASKNFG